MARRSLESRRPLTLWSISSLVDSNLREFSSAKLKNSFFESIEFFERKDANLLTWLLKLVLRDIFEMVFCSFKNLYHLNLADMMDAVEVTALVSECTSNDDCSN